VVLVELLSSDTETVDCCWIRVAHGELLSFADGPSRPDHGCSTVPDMVQVGIAAVIQQTTSKTQAHSKHLFWHPPDFGIINREDFNVVCVVAEHQVEFQEDCGDRKPMSAWNFQLVTKEKRHLQKLHMCYVRFFLLDI
jgi:hypothetical protein